MEEALRDLLLIAAPIAGVVGRRIDWGVRSQGSALPAITLHQIGGNPTMLLDGPADWERDRIQIDCLGRTYKASRDLADAIAGRRGVLVGYRGDHKGHRLRTFVVGRRSDNDSDTVGPVFRASIDVMIWHTPSPME
ncbi:hypothetical protein AVM11_08815 [Sphingomonas melonis TY]|uniref:DUF3168 domain-containing protein n=1 Tax=Sphingomonas melonis TY TaxID=621456 RepID=A0A175Y128_9SPHN|nr:DUF3168 domain-containing protein [Sphingomonas melonis]AOW22230.1 hypothetical protein BJP26_00565 [Sphingomonas melonis TY]KZB94096.1 hypothetical protein AVM11_08815 [Sphingomonas melonis TY]